MTLQLQLVIDKDRTKKTLHLQFVIYRDRAMRLKDN